MDGKGGYVIRVFEVLKIREKKGKGKCKLKGKAEGGIRKAEQSEDNFDRYHIFSIERNGKLGIIHYFSSLGNKRGIQ